MLTASPSFSARSNADARPITGSFTAAFDKQFDGSTTFFVLDESILDGPDVLAPDADAEIQEWDRYLYRNYSDRIVSMEWSREESFPYSVNLAMADVVLNNYDGMFTYGPKPKMGQIYDNFSGLLNSTMWYAWGGSNVVQDDGVVTITVPEGMNYYGMQTFYNFDMTGSFASCEVIDAGDQTIVSFEAIPIALQTENQGNGDNVSISITQGKVRAGKRVDSTTTVLNEVTYNPSIHKFFRIAESSGDFLFQYSTDASSWTGFASEPTTGFDVTDMRCDVRAGTYDSETVATAAVFDNFNCSPSGVPFATNRVSPIASYMLPRRPMRILSGFGGENIPQFVGLTEKSPKVNHGERTVTLHAMDFLSFIFNRPLDKTVMLQDKLTGEVLAVLFAAVGLNPAQYDLDISFNRIAFVYFEKGTKLGKAIRDLMQAELGSLYMDEYGRIRFTNRLKEVGTPVASYSGSQIVDYEISDDGSIINVVEIKANVRVVQPVQSVFSLGSPVELKANVQTEIFFSFEDPVVSLQPITNYSANSLEDGDGTNLTSNISVVSTELFATAVKVTFANAGPGAYLRELSLYGQPAKVTKRIYLRHQDDASVQKYEEQILTIENDYIQDENQGDSIALSILNYFKDYASTITATIKGTPQHQLGDNITIDVGSGPRSYQLTKIDNRIMNGQFRQVVTGKVFNVPTFFKLDESILDGPDVLAP